MSDTENNQDRGATDTSQPTQEAPAQEMNDSGEDDSSQTSRTNGKEHIDFRTAPPEVIEAKFGNIYGQMQRQDRTLKEYRDIAAAQARQIEELTNATSTVVDHLQAERFTDTETSLKNQMETAHQRGDSRSFLDAQDKLITVRAQKVAFEQQQKQKPQPQQQQINPNALRQPITSAVQLANMGVQNGYLASQDSQNIEAWQNEKDGNGNLVRPWAHTSDAQNPTPQYSAALREMAAVLDNPRLSHLPMEQKLQELDRRMGIQQRQASQQVMGANLTNGKRSGKLNLSDDAKKIAVRMKLGGSSKTDSTGRKVPTSDDDHIAAYRSQLEKLSAKKGARA